MNRDAPIELRAAQVLKYADFVAVQMSEIDLGGDLRPRRRYTFVVVALVALPRSSSLSSIVATSISSSGPRLISDSASSPPARLPG